MTLLRALLFSLLSFVVLAGCVLPGGSRPGASAGGSAASDIEVTALPSPGSAAASGAVKPKPRPGSEAVAQAPQAAPEASASPPATADPAEAAATEDLAPLEEAPPAVVKTPGQIACEKSKGRFVRAGASSSFTCVRPTRDGGKRCTRAGNCEGVCLARSQTCSPYTPVFGCQEIFQDDGLRITECIE